MYKNHLMFAGILLFAAILLHGGIYKAVPLQAQGGDIPLFVVNVWTGGIKFCNGYYCFHEEHKDNAPQQSLSPAPARVR